MYSTLMILLCHYYVIGIASGISAESYENSAEKDCQYQGTIKKKATW